MHESQVTPERTYPRPKPAPRGRWIIRHYHDSVAMRVGLRPEAMNRASRRKRFITGEDFREAIGALRAMPAPVAMPDPLAEDNRDLILADYYAASAARNRRKAQRRAVRAAGGQA